MATGQLGLTPLQYYDMTLGELMLAQHFWLKQQEHDDLQHWRRARSLMFINVRLWADPKNAPTSEQAFFPLPGDEKAASPLELSEAEQKQLFKDLRDLGWNV